MRSRAVRELAVTFLSSLASSSASARARLSLGQRRSGTRHAGGRDLTTAANDSLTMDAALPPPVGWYPYGDPTSSGSLDGVAAHFGIRRPVQPYIFAL